MKDDILLDWLNNAYSMELGLIHILNKHQKEASGHIKVAEAINERISETEKKSERLRIEIERLGGDISRLKAWGAEAFGWWHGILMGAFEDKLVKNTITEYALEYFEMATYQAISKAAEIERDGRVKTLAENILEENMNTADKLKKMLSEMVEFIIMSMKRLKLKSYKH